MPLLDLKNLKKILDYASGTGKEAFQSEYGRISTSSTGTLLTKFIKLEQQGAQRFFGMHSFDVKDLVIKNRDTNAKVLIIRLTDIQDRPKLFYTFMLSLLAEIFSAFPQKGESDQPELIICVDEAHLIFDTASKVILSQIESFVKLKRSKKISLYFVSQNPSNIPKCVWSQVGLKIQHASRAFTAKDRKAIKLITQNYPETDYYDTKEYILLWE